MEGSKFVIVGGGMVAGYAAKQLVEMGMKAGELVIFSSDGSLPYERPPLSKGFLAGKDNADSIRINPEEFYHDRGIEVRLETRVTAVDAARKQLTLDNGREFSFEKLVLATGSRAMTLPTPVSGHVEVLYLRSQKDATAIRERASGAKRAAIIGGGFIAMEVASVLAQKQIETTLVVREDRVWKRLFTPEMSRFFEGYFSSRGVRLAKSVEIAGWKNSGGRTAIQLSDGSSLESDLIVAGVGAQPATELADAAGIPVQDGVTVNEYLEAGVPGVLAAGDIANYPDALFQKRRRVEHWDNAVSQGQHCAKVLMGDRTPFRHVPYFFSDVFDLSYEFWGDPADAQTVTRGDVNSNSFSVWWLRDGSVKAAFVMNRPEEERNVAPEWIETGRRVRAEALADASRPIAEAGDLLRRAGS
jgi:NADPH-dependent 2,4-dienoyl-CoA reductase/sulfur reductase-like enzyme